MNSEKRDINYQARQRFCCEMLAICFQIQLGYTQLKQYF